MTPNLEEQMENYKQYMSKEVTNNG
jgi:hypothetical protein